MTDREKLIALCDTNNGWVDEVPAESFADYLLANGVVVREKGEWVKITGMAPPEDHGKHVCSRCYDRALERKYYEELSDFCPNCGADMRKGENDGKKES